MWSLVFIILMIVVFGKILGLAIKAAWGISRIIVTLVMMPMILIGLMLSGLLALALPLLIVVGFVAFVIMKD